jgi:hypothetical protein
MKRFRVFRAPLHPSIKEAENLKNIKDETSQRE